MAKELDTQAAAGTCPSPGEKQGGLFASHLVVTQRRIPVCISSAAMRADPQAGKTAVPAPKSCLICGREIQWRRKWERDWENVRYCSDGCRRRGSSATAAGQDAALEAAILDLLARRGAGKTICPSEAARLVAGNEARGVWEPLMEPARAAARRLAAAGRLVVMQGGHPVDPSHAKGPIRLKKS